MFNFFCHPAATNVFSICEMVISGVYCITAKINAMRYLKYYMILAALVSVLIELFSKHFSNIDFYTTGLTAAPFIIIYITLSCGTSCRRVDRGTRYSRSFTK
jgi:hypothetical protein